MSIDIEHLNQIDKIELQNQNYQIEIDKLKMAKAAETQKAQEIGKEVEKLMYRITELEMANQKNENLGAEKHRQLEYEIQMKESQVQIL